MNDVEILIILIPVLIVAELGIFGMYYLKKKKITSTDIFRGLYRFLAVFPLTKRSTERTTHRIAQLSIYGREQIPVVTTKYILKGLAFAALLVAAGLFLFSDILSKTMCIIFAIVLYSNVIDKSIDSTYLSVLKEMKNALQSIEQEYMKSESIPDALSNAKTGTLLARAIDEIHSIVSENNAELRLQQFYAKMPFHQLQTLAGICYNLNLFGDTRDIYGQSAFIQAIGILRSDVNASIEKLTLQKSKFSSLEFAPVLSVFLITPLEIWLTDTIPGVAMIYNGLLGFIFRTVVILSAIIGYGGVSRMNRAVVLKDDDRGRWTERLLKFKPWKNFILSILPKKTRIKNKIKLNIRQAMSKQKLEHFYTKKVVYAVIGFIGSLVVIIASLVLGKSFAKNTTAQLALVASSTRTSEQESAMRIMDEIYFKGEGNFSEAETTMLVRTYLPELSDMETADEVKRMQDKYKTWSEMYFRFYFVWIAVACGVLGFVIPNITLNVRRLLLKTDAEDDFMQLQTLVSILIYTGVDTLSVLQQMTQHSTVHKEILREAYHRFPSAPELELERLKTKTSLAEFKLFIDKLRLSISELPMTEAFSGLIGDRQSFQRLREIKFSETLNKKQIIGKFLSSAPLAMFAFAEFAFPIFILAFTEYNNTMGML